jgi:hypothetical protein
VGKNRFAASPVHGMGVVPIIFGAFAMIALAVVAGIARAPSVAATVR